MTAEPVKESFRLGFLTAIEVPERGFVGGLLVTNHFGRPLEFQCTAPLKPNRTQEILYGPTLVPYVLGDLIGRTLVEKVGIKPHIVLTERDDILSLRNLVSVPIACVDDLQETNGGADIPVCPGQTETSVPSQDGQTEMSAPPDKTSELEMAGIPAEPKPAAPFRLGRQLLRFHASHADDEAIARRGAAAVPGDADLREPFERVREALNEAARAGGGAVTREQAADGLAAPHFSIAPSDSLPECVNGNIDEWIGTSAVSLDLETDLFASGTNGALRRTPPVDTSGLSLLERAIAQPAWKASRQNLATFGVTFPEGVLLAPPPAARETNGGSTPLRRLDPPTPTAAQPGAAARPKRTKLRPPEDAACLKDRLFYLLQPPLETWLAGQELVMPFEPFSYQYEGIAWLFSQKSALLADEMGLGKTMQAITAIRLLMRSGQIRRVLLVCPKPLIPNWQREFKLWAEELPVLTLEGDAGRRRMLWTMPGINVLIANYELMSRDLEDFGDGERPGFDLLVLDEAQRVKNRESRTAQVARAIPRRRSWALTGTPIENRPEELGSLYEFMEVVPPRSTPDLKQLQRLSKTYVLRRTKDLVLTDLPPRLDRDEYLELTAAQQHAYKIAEKEGVIQLNDLGESISIQHVFELVLRLKQITNFDPLTGESAKLERLQAEMEEIAESNGKAILFSQWTRSIDWLKERLGAFGPLVYHGGVPTARREPILNQFRDDPNCHLLLMSYGTGAVGLNLQFAGYVFLFDRWWNPAVEDQAINRAHRIGQKNPVIVTKFISKDTIEERIDTVLRQKRELFASVLGDGKTSNASLSLSAAEIFGLFDLRSRDAKKIEMAEPAAPAA